MRARTVLRSGIQRAARRAGYVINRVDRLPTMEAAVRRLAPSHPVRTIVDVGASDGRWSEMVRGSYPDADFLLIEAQAAPHGAALARLAKRRPRMQYVLAAAGNGVGTIHFDVSDPFAGAASVDPFASDDLVVPMTTIDSEVQRLRLAPPFLVKLDTHGFEVPILEGAQATLAETSLLIVEAYNFELRPGALRFHELCSYLEHRGFRPLDVVDVMRRPGDGVLWQCDLVFAPSDRPEFGSNSYG